MLGARSHSDEIQITPAIVREAYSLLRQSIIHVEQDDINFDEEEDHVVPNGHAAEDGDETMDSADAAALDAAESSYNRTSSGANGESSAAAPAAAVPSLSKKKMRITCGFLSLNEGHGADVDLQTIGIWRS